MPLATSRMLVTRIDKIINTSTDFVATNDYNSSAIALCPHVDSVGSTDNSSRIRGTGA